MATDLIETRRQHLTADVERCKACGDRQGLADASASLRILGYLCDEEVQV